jgi:hypothetical protein
MSPIKPTETVRQVMEKVLRSQLMRSLRGDLGASRNHHQAFSLGLKLVRHSADWVKGAIVFAAFSLKI